ncbi:hypothetical protein [Metaplanococcus flavidus]|uniref:Uncharacterized protein n=1 Tax=Metaplanococcus flavidus TaxID=569883 RepID=A0ABW3L8B2_9BACL
MINIKKKYGYLLALIIIGLLVFSFLRWNDYREKDLVEVLDAEEIVEFRFADGTEEYVDLEFNGIVTDQESLQELTNFFSEYRVKKEGERNFETKYPDEQFNFLTSYEDDRITTSYPNSRIGGAIFISNQMCLRNLRGL